MRRPLHLFALATCVIAAPGMAARQAIGIYGGWGAFRDDAGPRCFAIAQALRKPQTNEQRPFASVGYWPGRARGGQVYIKLRRPSRPGSAVLLRIDDRTFQLGARGVHAWPADPRADLAIVQAMRTGLSMRVESRSATGAAVRDGYLLRGAATAIDAAAIACAPQALRS